MDMLIKSVYRFLVLGVWDGKSGWMEWRLLSSPTFSRYVLLLRVNIGTYTQGQNFTREKKKLKVVEFNTPCLTTVETWKEHNLLFIMFSLLVTFFGLFDSIFNYWNRKETFLSGSLLYHLLVYFNCALLPGRKSPVITRISRNNLWPGAYPHVTAGQFADFLFE